ncbi:LysR family transcriptional regulator [Neobacillus niacini]|uniref:LysR family transcriptional regulator n=1 Tax=Neobacillus niacini TaxID=86668 RepID=UPI003983BF8B
MHFEQLQYIAEIGKQGSITTAAEKLHVSPPAISKSISNLEKELGIQIFKRSKTGMVPTQQGKAVIKKAYEVLSKIHELREEAKLQEALAKTEIKISCLPGLTYSAFNSLLKLQGDFPEIIVEIQEDDLRKIIKDVKSGKCDIGIIASNQKELKDEIDLLYKEMAIGSPCILVGKNSPFAFNEYVTPDDLKNECLATYKGELMKFLLNSYFPKNRVVISSNNVEIIRKAIIEGMGIGVAFEEIFKNDEDVLNGEIIIIPLRDSDLLIKPICYIHANDKPLTPPAETFLNYVQEYWK